VVPRSRLFSLLDEAANRPIAWVSGPPGAGKTTLVASYVEARHLRHLWYQFDAGDADTATFVHYLRLAGQQVPGASAGRLPPSNLEPAQDLARFARGFCRDLFSALPKPCALVLDNFHEPRTHREQRVAFAQGLEELPDGVRVIVLSRSDPPPEFARLVASRRIARIDAEALRCTAEESRAILGAADLEAPPLQAMLERSEGWAAALVLLREHYRGGGATPEQAIGAGKEAIFRYFAGEILDRARPDNRRALMLTAIPPSITAADAVGLTGNEEAPRLLEYLYRHHLFTDLRHGQPASYHYHALFREFLLRELEARVSAHERVAATRTAARLLAARGQAGEALALYRDAADWPAMRALIDEHALEWARQGRAQALCDWIEALPKSLRNADPWLDYWTGRAWVFAQPLRGRPFVERAYEAFRRNDDARAQALALSTIVMSYSYEWASFAALDRWLAEFERLLQGGHAADLDAESELRARAAWLTALLLRNPEHESIARCAQRLDALLDEERDLNLRVHAGATLFNYINWKTDGEAAPPLIARIEPVLASAAVSPLMQIQWRTHLAFWHYGAGRYGESTKAMGEARAVAGRYGLEAYLFDIDHADASALINSGDHAAARARLDAMERRLSPTRRMQWPFFHHLRSVLEQRLGHAVASAEHAERATALARELDVPALQMPHFLARLAQARSAAGDAEGAMRAIDEAIGLASPVQRKAFEQRRALLAIEAACNAGDDERVSAGLAQVLGDHRARGDFVFMRSRPDLAARLANHALEHGIETEFVRALIARDALAAPSYAGAAWPFRLRVRVLGGFELVRDAEVVRFTGKAQQRPLDLLKLVVAVGGREVDVESATCALWPDADGAAARRSFESALFRLRKLLDIEDAVTLSGGKLSLDRTRAWTDVWALEGTLDEAEASIRNAPGGPSRARAARRLIDAYPGALLGTEEAPWIARPRDMLRARFVRTLARLGQILEDARDWSTAIDLYRRGLEADDLAEPLYRGLMRALAATGDRAEALNAFRRCRELLSIVLGVAPAGETERLRRDIAGGVAFRS
jgi:ATP/maltotriose-dependent transcriptional regulator MalT/DNA-binding SARP family transcriptional activator